MCFEAHPTAKSHDGREISYAVDQGTSKRAETRHQEEIDVRVYQMQHEKCVAVGYAAPHIYHAPPTVLRPIDNPVRIPLLESASQ